MHLLQLVRYFASICYAAFSKGMSVVSPEGYDHLYGSLHEEDCEDGSDVLNDTIQNTSHVEPVRTLFPSKLKAERGIVGECIKGDLLYIRKQSTERSLTPVPVNELLSNKKTLVKHKSYATYETLMGQSNDKKFLIPSTYVSKHFNGSTTVQALLSRESKQKCSINSGLNFGKFVWKNSDKLMMLVLITQVAAVQPFHNTTHVDLVPEGNATNSFSIIPVLATNEASFNMMPKNTSYLHLIHQYAGISEELIQNILHQSDTIINYLQELVNFLSTNKDTNRPPEETSYLTTLSRAIRSLPVNESVMCEIEQDTLINLRNELQATLGQSNEGGSNTCQLNFDSDRCEELIKLVLCGYTHLRNGFILAATKNMSEVINMRNKFAEFKEKYMILLDSIKRSHSHEYNMMKTKLETELQEQKNLLNVWISSLKEQKIKSCISEISSGKIESSVQDFKSLNDDSTLSKIIESVYSEYGSLSQIDNIVNFVRKLPHCVQHNISYTVLFDEMRKNNHLSSPNVLIVAEGSRRCMGDTFMRSYVEQVLDTWAHKVRINKDDELIIDFEKKNWIAFRAFLPDLIDKAYENELSNVRNIIFFVDKLHYLHDHVIGYSSLFNKMRSNWHVNSYETLILAYKVKEFTENYHTMIQQHHRDTITTLRNYLPNSIKRLIWGSKTYCTIFNVHYWEYLNVNVKTTMRYRFCNAFGLCASYGSYYSEEVYTQRLEAMRRYLPSLSPSMPSGQIFHWELDMVEKGKYFRIKNKQYDMFLLSSEDKYSSEKNHIRSGTCGDCVDTHWRLELEGDNFLIRSPRHDYYLYADHEKDDFLGHTVLGWSSRSIPDSVKRGRRWRIEC